MFNRLISTFRRFTEHQQAQGVILILCTLCSIALANSSNYESYKHLFEEGFSITLAGITYHRTWEHFINDDLMTVFFLLVGLEIKRELVAGELSTFRKAILPSIAALGGMIVPAAIYFFLNMGSPFERGWGIPMATDIAFTLGVLSIVGKRVPLSLKVFLTALAIIDDLGAIIVIALFYSGKLSYSYLIWAGLIIIFLSYLNHRKVRDISVYLLGGVGLWYCFSHSGIHSTIAGVVVAMLIPHLKESSPLETLEHLLLKPVNLLIMPLFALANTILPIHSSLGDILAHSAGLGILLGLVLGKPIGIFLFSRGAVFFGMGNLPKGVNWRHIFCGGLLAGIGFTMSIFVARLAFHHPDLISLSKLAILLASTVAALSGIIAFFLLCRHPGTKPLQ